MNDGRSGFIAVYLHACRRNVEHDVFAHDTIR
jgi:hypothetical protein